ncbi:MAG: hypothetical protein WBV94_13075 [Blastocatellia bacterium]
MDELDEQSYWFVEVWKDYRDIIKAIVGHALIVALLLSILELYHYWEAHSNVTIARREQLGEIDYYGSLGVMLIMVAGLVVEILGFVYKKVTNG